MLVCFRLCCVVLHVLRCVMSVSLYACSVSCQCIACVGDVGYPILQAHAAVFAFHRIITVLLTPLLARQSSSDVAEPTSADNQLTAGNAENGSALDQKLS